MALTKAAFDLKTQPLFKNFNDEILEQINVIAKEVPLGFRQKLRLPRNKAVPLMIVNKGCMVVETVVEKYGNMREIALALLMPGQLLFDFQFLGDKLHENYSFYPVTNDAGLISIEPEGLRGVLNKTATLSIFMENLSRLLIRKANIDDFRFQALSYWPTKKVIGVFLLAFLEMEEWLQDGKMPHDEVLWQKPLEIPINFSVSLLAKCLLPKWESIRDGMSALMTAGHIKCMWIVDGNTQKDSQIEPKDMDNLNFTKNKPNARSPFRILIPKPQDLADFLEGE